MGVVYLARQEKLNRLVALKMVLTGSHASERDKARFLTEAEAVARLHHPNIVQIFEIGESEGRPYFSLEYVPGGSLADKLNGAPLPAHGAAGFAIPLARAVQSAHDHGVVHRDLKPANVLLADAGAAQAADPSAESPHTLAGFSPKITDFGLAKHVESKAGPTQTGAVIGTPSYMAPEQASGQSRTIGPPADIYALGSILYELITGRPPFKGETPLDTVLLVLSQEPVAPTVLQPKCPRDLETICLKCLQKEPLKRYASASALADDLQRFQSGEPIAARPIGTPERVWRWTKRNPRTAGLLIALALVLFGGFVAVSTMWRVAVHEQKKAAAEKENADRQQARAKANLLKAIEAVDRMLTRVVDERLAYVPQFEDERRQILEDAVKFYGEFLEQESEDPQLRREMGRAYYRLGNVFFGLGKQEKAREALQLAQRTQEKLETEFPDPINRDDLAQTLLKLAASNRMVGRSDDALPLYTRAHDLAASLVADLPQQVAYRSTLADSLLQLGFLSFQIRQFEEAESYYRRSLAEWEIIVQAKPNEFRYRLELAKAWNSLGFFHLNTGTFAPAEEEIRKAIEQLEALSSKYPERKKDLDPVMADARLALAGVYTSTNRAALAEDSLRQGMAVYERLVKDYPLMPLYRFNLARGHQTASLRGRMIDRPEQSEQALNQAIALLEGLGRAHPEAFYQGFFLRRCYTDLAQVHRSQGKLEEAKREVEKAISHAQTDPSATRPSAPFRADVPQYLLLLAQIFAQQGNNADAIKRVDEAIAVQKDIAPKQPASAESLVNLQIYKALFLAAAGNQVAAIAEIDALPRPLPKDGNAHYNLACARSQCLKAILADPKLDSSTRQREAEHQRLSSLETLNQLKQSGYFRFPNRAQHLLKDTDLDPLRDDLRFKKFIEEIGTKPKPNNK